MGWKKSENPRHQVDMIYDELKQSKSIFPHHMDHGYTEEELDAERTHLSPFTKKVGKYAIFLFIAIIPITFLTHNYPNLILGWIFATLGISMTGITILFGVCGLNDAIFRQKPKGRIYKLLSVIFFFLGVSSFYYLFIVLWDANWSVYFLFGIAILPYLAKLISQTCNKKFRNMFITEGKNSFWIAMNLFRLWFNGQYMTDFRYNREIARIVHDRTKHLSENNRSEVIKIVVRRIDIASRESMPMFVILTALGLSGIIFGTSIDELLHKFKDLLTTIGSLQLSSSTIQALIQFMIMFLIPIASAALTIFFIMGIVGQARKKIYSIILGYMER